jgi:hypothetical protein
MAKKKIDLLNPPKPADAFEDVPKVIGSSTPQATADFNAAAKAYAEKMKTLQAPIPTGNMIRGKPEYDIPAYGNVYPTTNPDFTPTDPVLTTQVKFNQDGSVAISPKGTNEAITMSKEEYNTLQGGAGNLTNKVQKAKVALQEAEQADIPNIQEQFNAETQQVGGRDLRESTILNGAVPRQANRVANYLETIGDVLPLPSWLKFSSAKSTGTKQAEAAFLDMSSIIDRQISDYTTGVGSKEEIQRSIETARSSILDLYKETKGKGQVNLRFWLDNGKEIEAQINRELAILQSQQNKIALLP